MKSLTNKNFIQYAANHYDNPQCTTIEEFEEDLKRFQYLKRLFNRYNNEDDQKLCKLILNHLIVIMNVFGTEPGLKLLFLKLEGYYSHLVPFLIFMGVLPKVIKNVNGKNITVSDITLNTKVINHLRRLNEN